MELISSLIWKLLQFNQETEHWVFSGKRISADFLVTRSSLRSGKRQRAHREAKKLSRSISASGGCGLSLTAVLALAGIQRIVLPNLFGGSAVINPATNTENIKSLLSIYLRTSKRLRDQGGSGNDLTWLSF